MFRASSSGSEVVWDINSVTSIATTLLVNWFLRSNQRMINFDNILPVFLSRSRLGDTIAQVGSKSGEGVIANSSISDATERLSEVGYFFDMKFELGQGKDSDSDLCCSEPPQTCPTTQERYWKGVSSIWRHIQYF